MLHAASSAAVVVTDGGLDLAGWGFCAHAQDAATHSRPKNILKREDNTLIFLTKPYICMAANSGSEEKEVISVCTHLFYGNLNSEAQHLHVARGDLVLTGRYRTSLTADTRSASPFPIQPLSKDTITTMSLSPDED